MNRLILAALALLLVPFAAASDCYSTKDCVIPEDDAGGVVEVGDKDIVPGMKSGLRWRCVATRKATKAMDQDVGVAAGEPCGDKQYYDQSWPGPTPANPTPWTVYATCGPQGAGAACPTARP